MIPTKMTKGLKEKRIGDLFIEMGFVTEQQLKEALKVAKDQNVKVGEALCSMGVLDKDHIYWVLSNQLKMNYVELSREMIDEELMRQFSIDTLEQLRCVPLFEEAGGVHFALADPTDQQVVEKVKSLNPEKTVHLHLALPDKITETLGYFRRKLGASESIRQEEMFEQGLSAPSVEFAQGLADVHSWSDVVALMVSMSQGEVYWFSKTPAGCRLISQKEETFEPLLEYPEEVYLLIKERLKDKTASRPHGSEKMLFLQEKPFMRQGVFKFCEMDSFGREMIRIERMSTFLKEEFITQYPQASKLIEDLGDLLNDHPRILIGGEDAAFIKQCCYSLLRANDPFSAFPPPFFFETEFQTYLPGVAQTPAGEFNNPMLLRRLEKMLVPFIFYEAELSEALTDDRYWSEIFPGGYRNIILFLPFPSPESMKKALFARKDWRQAGFEAAFISQYELKSI